MASSLSMPISTFDILAEGKQSLEIANDRVNQILDKVGDIFKEQHMKQSLPKHSIAKIVRVETLMISVSIIYHLIRSQASEMNQDSGGVNIGQKSGKVDELLEPARVQMTKYQTNGIVVR